MRWCRFGKTMFAAGTVAIAAGGLAALASAHGSQTVATEIALPAVLSGNVQIDCSNSPGPTVTLSGELVLGGLDVLAIFRNNVKGTHEYVDEVSLDATVLPQGSKITVPKQPVRGGTGGNPFIWVQFLDGDGHALTGEIYLGRCVQGIANVRISPAMWFDTLAVADVEVDCANNPGPWITIDGFLVLPGLQARFIFRNNDNPVGGPHEATRVVDVGLIAEGTAIRFPKQPSLGGVGGNPWMWIQFTDPDGEPASDEIFIGRCVQGSK